MHDRDGEIEATVVFVDLVKFTSLTDVHGDRVGADAAVAIERIAARRSAPDAWLVKSTGDGVLLRAASPADGLRIAGEIVEDVHELGLDARAGVHHGHVLVRHGDIYGSTVNLAARLAEIARPATVAVTRPVALAAEDTAFGVIPLGPLEVSGLLDPVEVFLVDPCRHDATVLIDPVCGMRLDATTALRATDDVGAGIGFCSPRCAQLFAADPARHRPA